MTKNYTLHFLSLLIVCVYPLKVKSPAFIHIQQGLKFGPQFFDPARNLFDQIHLQEEKWDQDFKTAIDLNQVQSSFQQIKKIEAPRMLITQSEKWLQNLPPLQRKRIEIVKEKFEDFDQDLKINSVQSEIAKQFGHIQSIEGSLRLQKGFGLGDQSVRISRYYKNQEMEVGSFDPLKNKYKIEVKEPLGEIRAEVQSADGDVTAVGVISFAGSTVIPVSPLPTRSANAFDFGKHPDLGLQPSPKKFVHAAETLLSGAEKILNEKTRGLNNISKHSVLKAHTQGDGLVNSYQIVSAREDLHIPAFKNSFVQSLRKALDLEDPSENLLLGQVLVEDKPVPDAEIRIVPISKTAQASVLEAKIHFFQNWFPAVHQSTTGRDGTFLVSNIEAGFYQVQAYRKGIYLGFSLVETKEDQIASIKIQLTLKKSVAQIRTYDAFFMNALSAQVKLSSFSEEMTVNGEEKVSFSTKSPWGLASAIPANPIYENAIYNYSEQESEVFLPLLQKSWLEGFRQKSLTISPILGSGLIIGFVPDKNFEVFLPEMPKTATYQIWYFNSSGQIVEKGQQGGGFVITNLPEGLTSVTVLSPEGVLSSQLIWTTAEMPSIGKFLF